jgi:DNA-binding GntR family transcriptional regulator
VRHDGQVTAERIGHEGLDEVLRRLAVRHDVPRPPQVSTGDHVAAVLSQALVEGELPPGTQLSEERIGRSLQVSRNTLREAFRLLSHDGLLVHHRHRGVFVPVLDEDDLTDLYRLRIALETGVLRALGGVDPGRLRELEDDVRSGEVAARRGRWRQVGTANMDFHQHLLALSDSPRMTTVGRQVLAQTRLAFLSLRQPRTLHEPFLGRNRELVELLAADRLPEAAAVLEGYLHDSRDQLIATLRSERS